MTGVTIPAAVCLEDRAGLPRTLSLSLRLPRRLGFPVLDLVDLDLDCEREY